MFWTVSSECSPIGTASVAPAALSTVCTEPAAMHTATEQQSAYKVHTKVRPGLLLFNNWMLYDFYHT